LYRTSPLSQTFRELGAERNGRKFGHEKYRKSLENIADNAGGQDAVARVAPPAHLTKIQQKRTCLQIPAQSRIFVHADAENVFGFSEVTVPAVPLIAFFTSKY